GLLVALIALTELASRMGWVSSLMIPAPSAVAETLVAGLSGGAYWEALLSTLYGAGVGFAIAAGLGLSLGGILTAIPRLESILYPYVVAFQATPTIAIAPLVIIWVGFGDASKVAIVVIVCFFPILINTLEGLRIRDKDQQELVVALGANKWQVFRYVRLPGSTPYVFAGLTMGAIFALLGAVVAEFVGVRDGLGVLMNQQRAVFNVPGVFAVLIILVVIGVTVSAVMKYVERRVTFWARE